MIHRQEWAAGVEPRAAKNDIDPDLVTDHGELAVCKWIVMNGFTKPAV
jgi:hypothetical protein